ncbi:MAG: cofactor-independent phosphoglycerate mutase [Candidatus Omnitrophica bacterium]|nr:cofactor-independent phosphoglycerate mutase [Candidatus Omnitrophota bacterium]
MRIQKLKTIVLVCDGMGDVPVEKLGGKTPLEAAKTPVMDGLAKQAKVGLARTIPDGFVPASDVGNMAILGYDPHLYYSGRAPLEAANMGVELKDGDVAFRCNLVTTDGDTLVDYSAGHISSEEATTLITHLDSKLRSTTLRFYPGIQYRHLAVFSDPKLTDQLTKTVCQPPHDFMGWKITDHLPKGPAAKLLMEIMNKARELLVAHEVNQVRIDLKENPGNMIWLWGQGKNLVVPTFKERWNLTGSVISAVDLVKGAGRLAGLEVLNVPGATGYYDTNYAGKAEYALESLKKHDFVFVHIEAADEAGHNGDLRQKITAIENFDKLIVGAILEGMKSRRAPFRVLIIPDHLTPVEKRTHTPEPVPFMIFGEGIAPNGVSSFGETKAKESGWLVEDAYNILPRLLTEAAL